MRIETNAFGRPVVRPYTSPAKEFGYGGSKMKHTQTQVLTPQKGFIKCPRCLNGVAKQSVDAKDLVWDCVMCGWSQPMREPDMKHYGEDKIDYEKRY
jgi:ribosomal protein L37AE/L43A